VDRGGGFFALKIMHASLYVVGYYLFYRFFRKATPKPGYAIFFLVLLIFLSEDRLRLRPEAFNTFFLSISVPIALGPVRKTSWKELAVLFFVALLWGNIHAGGALMLPILFGGVLVGRSISRAFGAEIELRDDVYRFLASTGILLVLPGFIKGVYTALFMYSHSYALIPEWHPPADYFDPRMSGRTTGHHLVDGITPYLTALLTYVGVSWAMVRNGLPDTMKRLDGGHIVIITVESLLRRPLPVKLKMVIQQVGFILLLILLLIIMKNDLLRTGFPGMLNK
jgi:hypothetical protein